MIKLGKNTMCMTMLFVLMAQFMVPVFASDFEVDAKSSVLMEPYTKTLLIENNAQEELAPASVTKVMTILLIYEALEQGKMNASDIVTISEHAAQMGGSQVYLEPFEQQSVETLLKCIVVASANDAAVAMAEQISGSEEAFVNLMNEKAKELGMNNTHFMNACGLDADNHYTSAKDIAIMSSELITKYPQVFEYTTIWQDSMIHETKRGQEEFGLTNTNRLIKTYTGATGLKTGSTGKALYCLSGTAKRDNMHLVAVVMGAPDAKTRFQETAKLLDYGFANYGIEKGDEAGTVIGQTKIYKGMETIVDAVVFNEATFLTEKGSETTLDREVNLKESVSAPINQGDELGEIIYYINEVEAGRSKLVAAKDIEKTTLGNTIKQLINNWF